MHRDYLEREEGITYSFVRPFDAQAHIFMLEQVKMC